MVHESILPRQRYAFLLCAVSAPAVTVASGLPWVWVLAVTMLAASLLVGLFFLQSRGRVSPAAAEEIAWGKWGRRAVAVGQFLFAVVLLWHLALGTDSAFPEENTLPFVPLTLLALCAWSAFQGRAAVVRAAAVLFFLLLGLYGAVFFFAAEEVELNRLTELSLDKSLLPLGVVLLTPFYGHWLFTPQEKRGKFPAVFLLLFLLLPAAAAAVCAAVPGSGGSFYNMARSIEALSFAQRMEPLVSVLLTVGWFCALSLITTSCGQMAGLLGIPPRWGAVSACLLCVPGILWQIRFSPWILLLLGSVFSVLHPLLTQCFVVLKKGKNFLKKPQKNC